MIEPPARTVPAHSPGGIRGLLFGHRSRRKSDTPAPQSSSAPSSVHREDGPSFESLVEAERAALAVARSQRNAANAQGRAAANGAPHNPDLLPQSHVWFRAAVSERGVVWWLAIAVGIVLLLIILVIVSNTVDSWMLHEVVCDDCGDDEDTRLIIGADEDHPGGRDDPTDDEDRHIFYDDDLG